MSARKPKMKSFALRLPAGLYRKVYSEALKQDRSVNVTMEVLIRQGLKSLAGEQPSTATTPGDDEWPTPGNPQPIVEDPETFK